MTHANHRRVRNSYIERNKRHGARSARVINVLRHHVSRLVDSVNNLPCGINGARPSKNKHQTHILPSWLEAWRYVIGVKRGHPVLGGSVLIKIN